LFNKNLLLKHPYRTINAYLAGCIFLIFIYSAIFSPQRARHPIPSSHTLITGEPTKSTGLSRAFSAIVRLKFSEARAYNVYGIRIFLFFLIQFFIRIFLFLNHYIIIDMGESRIAILDTVLSSVLFLFLFEPFISEIFGG
jgi:hypothetical protein